MPSLGKVEILRDVFMKIARSGFIANRNEWFSYGINLVCKQNVITSREN